MLKLFLYILGLCCYTEIAAQQYKRHFTYSHGGIVRGDSTKKELALVFTADEFGEGLPTIIQSLKQERVKAAFFLTGRFYRNKAFANEITVLKQDGHYFGPHSDQHLLYCDWNKRDSLLVSRDSFEKDITHNLGAMVSQGLPIITPHYFIPPYEWWNDTIASWSKSLGLEITSFTPGIRTNTDYTYPEMGEKYKSNDWILDWLKIYASAYPQKLNGAIILVHAGTDPRRKEKLYNRLVELIQFLKSKGYKFKRLDELLMPK